MAKTASIHVRINPKVKNKVEKILASLGLTHSEAIAMFYSQVELQQGIPFEVKVPNKRLRAAMDDVLAKRNLTRYDSLEELMAEFK